MSKIRRFGTNWIRPVHVLALLLAAGGVAPLGAQTVILASIVPEWPSVVQVGVPYSMQFVLDPDNIGPHTGFEVEAGTVIPAGFSFNSTTGVLAGTATTAGIYPINLRVDTIPASNIDCEILYKLLVVLPLSLAPGVLPPGNVGTPYMAAVAQNGIPPYTFGLKTGALPPGLAFDAPSGTLKGTPTAQGLYYFSATIGDATNGSVTGAFSVTIGPAGNVYATATSVTFQAMSGGAVQTFQLGVLATDLSTIQFAVSVPASAGGSLPGWLKVTPMSGATPGQLTIQADPGPVAPGSYQTYIQVTAPGQGAIMIGISLTVANSMQSFAVAPGGINVTYPAGTDLTQAVNTTIQVSNNGGTPVSGSVVAEPTFSGAPWLSVTPSQFNLIPGQAQTFSVSVLGANTQGTYGTHFGMIDLKSSKQTLFVPVTVDIRKSNAVPNISVSPQSSYWFLWCDPNATGMGGPYYVGDITVQNSGPSTAYTTSLQGFGNPIQATPPSGTDSAPVEMSFDACKLGLGDHTGYLSVTAPKLTPGTVYQKWEICVGDLKSGNTEGCPKRFSGSVSPDSGGLVMVSQGTAKPTTTITVTGTNDQPLNFTVGLNSGAPAGVSVSPASFVATATPTKVTLTADPTKAPAGVSQGQATLASGGGDSQSPPLSIAWALVYSAGPGPNPNARPEEHASAAAVCSPTQIVLVPATPSYFSQKVDWPMSLKARLVDDCGQAINGASVTAWSSNGDPALALAPTDSVSGVYAATWRPANPAASVTVTFRAMTSNLPTATHPVYGSVLGDPTAPIVSAGGVVNNLNPVLGAPIAPGTVASIYGSNLAISTVASTTLPVPTTLGGAQVLIGGIPAPLFFASPGQINAQIPAELPANSAPDVMVLVNGNVSIPRTIQLGAVNPGIAAYSSGRAIAQHGDYSLVTPDSPARPGEWIVFYLVGMGATSPAVGSNQTAPSSPLAYATVQPAVTIDGVAATVLFAGLTPGGVGLYQINCQVPPGARTGDLPLVVVQSDAAANAVTLPVAQ